MIVGLNRKLDRRVACTNYLVILFTALGGLYLARGPHSTDARLDPYTLLASLRHTDVVHSICMPLFPASIFPLILCYFLNNLFTHFRLKMIKHKKITI